MTNTWGTNQHPSAPIWMHVRSTPGGFKLQYIHQFGTYCMVCMYFTYSHSGCSHPGFEVYHLVRKSKKKRCGLRFNGFHRWRSQLRHAQPGSLETSHSSIFLFDPRSRLLMHPSFLSGTPVLRLEIVCGLWKRTGKNRLTYVSLRSSGND